MKKITVIGFMITLLVGALPLFAKEELNLEAALTVNLLIKHGLEKNLVPITRLSGELSMLQRMLLYNQHETKPVVPFVINLLVGGGIGSFVQGDIGGGITGLVGDVLSLTAIIGGYVLFVKDAEVIDDSSSNRSLAIELMVGGIIGLTISRIYQLVQPFTYAKKRNETLENVLGVFAY